jgi:hypothetical protein
MAVVRRAGCEDWFSDLGEAVSRAFSEFLAIPSYVIVSFLTLAVGSYLFDRAHPAWLAPVREMLRTHVFSEPDATSSLLSTIAGGLITVTSITISLLLLALQQSAATMTAEVFDQFLRRRLNQVYFGFFIGLALYSLVTLATVASSFNPVFGATIAVLLTVIALYLLIVLLYTSVRCRSCKPFTTTFSQPTDIIWAWSGKRAGRPFSMGLPPSRYGLRWRDSSPGSMLTRLAGQHGKWPAGLKSYCWRRWARSSPFKT